MAIRKIDRFLLAIYLVALFGLIMLPISGTEFRLLGIESDKWIYVALFGGLAVLLRWNISERRHALFVSVAATFFVAAVAEVAHGLVDYRSAESWDVVAGLIGAVLGATGADRILSSEALRKLLGPVVAILGLMVGLFFLLADVIGVGNSAQVGTLQVAGMALGALIAVGGAQLSAISRRASNHGH